MQELSKNDVMNYTLFKFHMDGDLNNPKSLLQFVLQEFEKVDMIAKDKFGAKIGSITFYGRGGYGNNCSFPINISEIMEKEICNNERLSLTKNELDDLYKSFGGKFYSGDLSITNISFGNIVPKEKCFMIEPQTEYLLLNYYSNFKESNDMLDYNRRYGGCNDYIAKPKAQIILKRDEEVVFSFDKHPEWMNEVANILNLTSRATNTASQIYRIPNKYANIMHRCTRIPITEKEYNSYYKSFGNNFYSGDFSYLEVTRLELEKSLEIIEIDEDAKILYEEEIKRSILDYSTPNSDKLYIVNCKHWTLEDSGFVLLNEDGYNAYLKQLEEAKKTFNSAFAYDGGEEITYDSLEYLLEHISIRSLTKSEYESLASLIKDKKAPYWYYGETTSFDVLIDGEWD